MAQEREPPSAAQALYPHLPSGVREPLAQRPRGSLADAMYPKPQSRSQPNAQPAKWQPKPDFRDWSGIDVRYARLLGLVPKRRG